MGFVEQAMNGHPCKSEIVKFLKTHSKINNLCYIPFYMSVLISLCKQDGLPTNPSELYVSFVRLTIC